MDATLTTWPRPRSTIPGSAARMPLIGPITFTSKMAPVVASASSRNGPSGMIPALLTSTSRGPPAATNSSNDSGEVTSSSTARALRADLLGDVGRQLDVEVAQHDRGPLTGEQLRPWRARFRGRRR